MKFGTFLFVNAMVAFICGVVLYDMSRMDKSPKVIKSLRPYYDQKSVVRSSLMGVAILVVSLVITMMICSHFFKFMVPKKMEDVLRMIVVAYGVGFVINKVVDVSGMMGNRLQDVYNFFGLSGHLGAMSLVVCIVVSHLIHGYLIPKLK